MNRSTNSGSVSQLELGQIRWVTRCPNPEEGCTSPWLILELSISFVDFELQYGGDQGAKPLKLTPFSKALLKSCKEPTQELVKDYKKLISITPVRENTSMFSDFSFFETFRRERFSPCPAPPPPPHDAATGHNVAIRLFCLSETTNLSILMLIARFGSLLELHEY